MKKQTVVPKKKRGPPATGKGTQIQVRLQPEHLDLLDEWISTQAGPMSRPDALRQIAVTMLVMFQREDARWQPAIDAFVKLRTERSLERK